MDNIGDWLYIVFLVIAGISSLFGSKDKKKAKKRPEILGQPDEDVVPSDQPSAEKGFWEILQETQKRAESPTPKPRPAKKKKAKAKRKIAEGTPSPQPISFLKKENHFPRTTESLSSTPIQPIEDETGFMPEETFKDMGELRKAIICSEILNRKY